jgi:hypothetical protein
MKHFDKLRSTGACLTVLAFLSCSDDSNPSSGEFYVKATINPPVEDVLWGVGAETFSKSSSTESSLQSDPITVQAKDNVVVEVAIIGYTHQCHTVSADFYYLGKVMKSVEFEMRGMASTTKCKDGYSQLVNMIIPG